MTVAPYFSELADLADGESVWLTAKDGVRLRATFWAAANAAPKGTVFIFPGRTEYVEKYGRVARELRARGYGALAIDWRGQGLADRIHDDPGAGHVEEFSHYQDDLAAVIAEASARDLPRPWHMLAHSMGGCIGLRTLMGDHPFQSAAFSAPMWGIQMATALRPVATGLAAMSKRVGLSHLYPPGYAGESYFTKSGFNGNNLTTDEETYLWMRNQIAQQPELSLGGPSLHWLHEALTETKALAQMDSPSTPALTFLGTDEQIVDSASIRDRMGRWPTGELVEIEKLRHEVLMEAPAIRDPLIDRMVAFYDTTGAVAVPA